MFVCGNGGPLRARQSRFGDRAYATTELANSSVVMSLRRGDGGYGGWADSSRRRGGGERQGPAASAPLRAIDQL